MADTFATPRDISLFVVITLKAGLKLYAATGMKPNRQWTPKNMMNKAEQITGRKFKARAYQEAIQALQAWIDAEQAARLAPPWEE